MAYWPTIEIPVFLATFGLMLTVSVNNNLLIYRTCYVLLHYNKTQCAELGFVNNNETQHLEELVEPTATYISLVKTIVESIVGSVLCLYIAPWSDRFGRKPVIIVSFVGGIVSMLLYIVFAAVDTLTPWFLLVMAVPVLVTGGGGSIGTVISAYLSDSTSNEKRGLRMGLFDIMLALAVMLGNSASSYILIATNYVVVYCISAACHLLALAYTIFFVPESLQERETENMVSEIFSTTNLLEMLKTPFKRRESWKRSILLLLMLSVLFGYMTSGSGSLFFYFVREKLHWTLIQFTWFGTATSLLGMLGGVIVIYLLHTVLKVRESILILVGSLCAVGSNITNGIAFKDWHVYLGAILNLPSSCNNALLKSLVSKLVGEDEVAKVFSAFSIGSNVLIPISGIAYTELYNRTISTDPGLYNFVTATILFASFVTLLCVVIVQRKAGIDTYATLVNDGVSEDEPENCIASQVGEEVNEQ